jgi:hypothetical protein
MPAVRSIAAVLVAATIAVTGCTTYSSRDQPSPPSPAPNPTHAPRPPTHRTDPTTPVDRQSPIYTAVLRHYLTSGDASFGGFRFPRIFVLDHAVAGVGGSGGSRAAGGEPISPPVRRAVTRALADVGPLTFVSSADAVIVNRDGCAHVRDQGILITLGQVEGVGDQVQVAVHGVVACLGASSLTYRVERASGAWRVSGVAAWGPVS